MKPSYYTPGNPKRQRRITREWFEKIVCKAFTDQDVIDKLKTLEAKECLDIIVRYLPKEVKQENHSLIRLVINGLPQGTIVKEMPQATEVKAIQDDHDDES